jgi:hypothetical protein
MILLLILTFIIINKLLLQLYQLALGFQHITTYNSHQINSSIKQMLIWHIL